MIPSEARLNPRFKSEVYHRLKAGENLAQLETLIQELIYENIEYYRNADIQDISKRMHRLDKVLRKHLVNRGETIRQGMRALMTGEHQFIFSSAGVAKSLYAKQLFSCFKNSDVFSMQFCPDTTPDDLFGAYDIEKFKKGEIYHNIEDSIITHPFAFLDEFMDGNDKLLRTLLGVLLERRFIAGAQVEEAMLHSAIATSNYMRRSETTEALLDRFLYKSYISSEKDLFTLLRIDQVYLHNTGHVSEIPEELKIKMRELVALKRMVLGKDETRKITIPTPIHFLKNMIASSFEYEMKKYRLDFYISPRTISKSNDLIKANTVLNDRQEADINDLEGLHYLFCTLNEPLEENGRLLSQHLFSDVVKSKRQYYRVIEKEIKPLLLYFDIINNIQYQPELLNQPMRDLLVVNNNESFVESWLNFFSSSQQDKHQSLAGNKDSLIKKIEESPSHYREVIEFKRDLLEQTHKVFSEYDL